MAKVLIEGIGWFNAYGFAAHNVTADVFIHLGDYVGSGVTLCSSFFLRPKTDI